MSNWLKKDLDYLIGSYQKDIDLISKKKKEEEWKRDHYRYISAVHFQRIFNNLNTRITETPAASLSDSTKLELKVLRNIIDDMLVSR